MSEIPEEAPVLPGEEETAAPEAEERQERAREGPAPGERDPEILEHLCSLTREAEALRREYPDFELGAALRDPAFVRMTAPAVGVGLREAYYALHRDELERSAFRRGAEGSGKLVARAAASGGLRPREGGGLGAAVLTRSDYRALSRPEQQSLKQRIRLAAARGEKLYP